MPQMPPMEISIHVYDPDLKKKQWVRVASDEDVQEAVLTTLTAGGREILLTRVGGTLCAIDGACPHRGAPLASGRIQEGAIRCPQHGYEFDLRTGKGIGNDHVLETVRAVESDTPPGQTG